MKISINTPCHENWNEMQADEKGAFCLACQKTVVDFSNKTIGEIKDFFNELKGSEKVCGRFEEQQLTALNFDDFFRDFVNWKFIRKVALIVFFVFGLSLFGNAQSKPVPKPKPKVVVAPTPLLMGAIAYVEDTVKVKTPKDSLQEPKQHIRGKVQYTPEQPAKKISPRTKTMGEPEVK